MEIKLIDLKERARFEKKTNYEIKMMMVSMREMNIEITSSVYEASK